MQNQQWESKAQESDREIHLFKNAQKVKTYSIGVGVNRG